MPSTLEHPVIAYHSPGARRPKRDRTAGEEAAKIAFIATLFVIYGLLGNPEKSVDLFLCVGLVLWLAAMIFVSAKWWRLRLGARIGVVWILGALFLFAVTLASLPLSLRNYYTCPHGERWANNLFAIAKSSTGGPCGNGPYCRGERFRWHIKGPWYFYIPMESSRGW